jgi:hypothetical protein
MEEKLILFIKAVYKKFEDNVNKLAICDLMSAYFINYLIDKGFILASEKRSYSEKAVKIIEMEFGYETADFVRKSAIDAMQVITDYDYEVIYPFIREINIKK